MILTQGDPVEIARRMQSAAFDPGEWEPALNAVNTFVEGTGVVLLSVSARGRFAPASTGMAEMMEDYFNGGWYANDRRDACVALLKSKGIVFDHEFQSVEDIEDCDYYHDFLSRHRQKWFAGIAAEVDGDDWCLALQRAPDIGPFSAADMTKLRVVKRLLSNTASLFRFVGRAWIGGMRNALDLIGQPAAVFDSHARLVDINDAALAIIGAFVTEDGEVVFRRAQDNIAFTAMMRSALNPLDRPSDGNAAYTICPGAERYSCRVTSLLPQESLIATSAAVLLVMKPAAARSAAGIMKSRYGLTDTEIAVALALAEGKTVKEIAMDKRVKENTVRTQLKSVFSKTENNKQSKLVAFVQNLTPEER